MKSEDCGGSDLVDNVRNMSISRRGGVRTRGGRLPPIIHRDIAKVTGAKKIIAPKIPQRRIKKEPKNEEPVALIKKEPADVPHQNDRDRGRGRGQRVYLQTEGTFLAEGPAAKLKREPIDLESYSIPRATRSTARETVETQVDLEVINELLNSYEANEAYEDDIGTIAPYRLPLLKQELMPKTEIKTEPLNLVRIKTEIKSDDEDIEKPKPDIKVLNKVKTECKTEIQSEAEEFFNVKDDGMLILLQWPNVPPFADDEPEVIVKTEDNKREQQQPKSSPSFIDKIPEGQAGKLQILKSGRKRLVLGSVTFEVVDGTESESLKECVSIRMREEGGDITVIGKIDKSMVAMPMVNQILDGENDI